MHPQPATPPRQLGVIQPLWDSIDRYIRERVPSSWIQSGPKSLDDEDPFQEEEDPSVLHTIAHNPSCPHRELSWMISVERADMPSVTVTLHSENTSKMSIGLDASSVGEPSEDRLYVLIDPQRGNMRELDSSSTNEVLTHIQHLIDALRSGRWPKEWGGTP